MTTLWCADSETPESRVIIKIPICCVLWYGESHCDNSILSPEALTNMYQLIPSNLEQVQKKRDTKAPEPDKNIMRVILFYLRITPQVYGTLGVLGTIE